MKKHSKWILSLALLTLIGCKSPEEEETQATSDPSPAINSSANIELESFENVQHDQFDSSEAEQKIKSTSSFNRWSNSNACSKTSLIMGAVFQKEEGKDTYKTSVPDTSINDCYNSKNSTFSGNTVFSFSYEGVKVEDKSGNPVDIEGKTLSEASQLGILVQSKVKSYTSIQGRLSIYPDGGTKEVNEVLTQLRATPEGGPCITSGNQVYQEDCLMLSHEKKDNTILGHSATTTFVENNLVKLTYRQGLSNPTTFSKGYYTDGTIDFQINDWSGTMTYASSPSYYSSYISPSYTASNGTTQISGTHD